MARIRNTEPETYRTRALYNAELMGEHYDPPGIKFLYENGTVAPVKEEIAQAVADHYDHLELVSESSDTDTDAESSEKDTTEETE